MDLPTLNLEQLQAAAIVAALERFKRLEPASAALGITRFQLMRKMRALGLKAPEGRGGRRAPAAT